MPKKARTVLYQFSTPAVSRRPDRRLGARARGYGSDWERIRAAHLRVQPDCVQCGGLGSHVDHITPRRQGGGDDAGNLQTLCARCHSRKTATSDGGFGHAIK